VTNDRISVWCPHPDSNPEVDKKSTLIYMLTTSRLTTDDILPTVFPEYKMVKTSTFEWWVYSLPWHLSQDGRKRNYTTRPFQSRGRQTCKK